MSIRDTLADVERRDDAFGGFTFEAAAFRNILSKPWKMTFESGQPIVGPECPDHHALPVGQNEPTGASPANVEAPGRTDGIVDARSLVVEALANRDEYQRLMCHETLHGILRNDLFHVPGSIVAALMAAHLVGEARICVDECGFNLVSTVFGFNFVSMYDVNRG